MTKHLPIALLAITLISGCGETATPSTNETGQAAAPGSSVATPAANRFVDVEIRGLSTFYLEKDSSGKYINPTVLMIRDPSGVHKTEISLPGVNSQELLAAINKSDCTTLDCELPVVGIRVADGNTPLTTDFVPSNDFNSIVLKLRDQANPNFTDFTDDARDPKSPPKAGGSVIAYLDLHGGEVVDVKTFGIPAHFNIKNCKVTDIAPQQFARSVTVRFKATEPVLQFISKTNGQDPVHFLGTAPVKMTLKNAAAGSGHMHLFSQLSKSGVCLPEIITDHPAPGPDYVPGCGNTQWP